MLLALQQRTLARPMLVGRMESHCRRIGEVSLVLVRPLWLWLLRSIRGERDGC